ncbi:MAG: hypothetical protein IT423_16650, partial [Pirellulaceae bacterium]|nr:hypothetical protein [Pirellulaceae bacterium]
MTTERPKTSLFQYGLLILLAVIAVGVWLNRSSGSKEQAPALVTGENLRAESPFPNAPGGSRNVVLPELEQLADSIKQGDVKVIEPAWRNALMVRNSQYLIKLYRLICEHGNEEALAAIGTTMQPLSSQDIAEVLAGLTDLLDRKQYAGLLFVLDKKATSIGLFMEHVKPWLIKEFQREPWEDQRFSAIIQAVKANRRP